MQLTSASRPLSHRLRSHVSASALVNHHLFSWYLAVELSRTVNAAGILELTGPLRVALLLNVFLTYLRITNSVREGGF